MAVAPAAASARPSASRGSGRRWRFTSSEGSSSPSASSRLPASDAPSSPVTPTRSPGLAPSRPTSSSALSAQPTTATVSTSTGPETTSPPAIVTPVSAGQLLHPVDQLERVAEVLREHHRYVRLAGLGPHRRDVGQRRGQRLPADVAGGVGAALEVDAVDERVDGVHRERPCSRDGRVVSCPANEPSAAVGERPFDCGDEAELAHGRSSARRQPGTPTPPSSSPPPLSGGASGCGATSSGGVSVSGASSGASS